MGYFEKGKYIEGYVKCLIKSGDGWKTTIQPEFRNEPITWNPKSFLIDYNGEVITLNDLIEGWMDCNKRYLCLLKEFNQLLKEIQQLKCKSEPHED